jgi:hypothetical protein
LTVRHSDTNAYVGVDCAGVRLRQAIARKLRSGGEEWRTRQASTSEPDGRAKQPRLAVVVSPAGRRPRLGLGPWLRTRYGIEQLQMISVSGVEWVGLASDSEGAYPVDRLRHRLALSLLGRPELIVVAGHPPLDDVWQAWPRSRWDVERIVERIRSWDLPVEVIGMWVNERWDADECLVESEAVETHARGDVAVLSGRGECPQWLAERVWEDEGGRLKHPGYPVVTAGKHPTARRNRHVVSDFGRHATGHAKARQGTPPRDPVGGLPGLRSHPARLGPVHRRTPARD